MKIDEAEKINHFKNNVLESLAARYIHLMSFKEDFRGDREIHVQEKT